MSIAMLLVILVVVVVVLAVPSVRVVPEDQRLTVFRLGRYVGVRGPGLVLIAPVIDSATQVSLDEVMPGWRGLPPDDVAKRVRRHLGV